MDMIVRLAPGSGTDGHRRGTVREHGDVRVLRITRWPGRGDRPGGTRAGPGRVRGPGPPVTPDRTDPGPDGHPARRRAVGAGHRRLRGGDHRLVRRPVHRPAARLRGRLPDRLRALAGPG